MRAMLPPPRRAALAVLVVAGVLLAVAGNAHRSAAAASVPVYYRDDDDWAADAGYGYGYGGVAACAGTAAGAECAAVVPRRELGGGGTIGYGALDKNNVPCSQRGVSYYNPNCGSGAPANSYTRGCSTINRCRP